MQIAAGGGDGIGGAPRQHVEEGLFFYGVHVDGTGVGVGQGVIFAPSVFPHPAVAPVAIGHFTGPGTEETLNLFVLSGLVKQGGLGIEIALLNSGTPGGVQWAGEGSEGQGAKTSPDKGTAAQPRSYQVRGIPLHRLSLPKGGTSRAPGNTSGYLDL